MITFVEILFTMYAALCPVYGGYQQAQPLLNTYAQINEYRQEYDQAPMYLYPSLETSAKAKAAYLVDLKEFAHFPTGSAERDLYQFYYQAGYQPLYWGENLAKGYNNMDDVIVAWQESPIHNDLLLSPHFEHMGLGLACDSEDCIVTLHVGTL